MRLLRAASVWAGVCLCRRSVPARSRKASSSDSGSTSGVVSSISCFTWRLTAAYFCMSGRTTTAFGQAFSALNIGMADFTPKVRAT